MVFIRPKILRDGAQAAIETNSKYNYMRDEQRKATQARAAADPAGRDEAPELPPAPPPAERPRRLRAAPAREANEGRGADAPTTPQPQEPPTPPPQAKQ